MKRGYWLVIALLVAGIGWYALAQSGVFSGQELQDAEYIEMQQDPVTHDFNRILPYQHPYMGNAANLGNLFDHLPLSDVKRTYQLYPDTLTAEIHYQAAAAQVKESMLHKSLIYNAIAAFALIDNLEHLRLIFVDKTYATDRERLELIVGRELSGLLAEETWKTVVQEPLADPGYVQDTLKKAFTVENGD